MDRKFLEEYQARENEDLDAYTKGIIAGKINENESFPKLDRFGKINAPIVKADLYTYALDKEKIWSQIPFSGTLLLPLFNISASNFLGRHSFDVSDIEKLVELAKETGRVQFGLVTMAENYEGLDYLDPIFQELKPPVLTNIPFEKFVDEATVDKWTDEFYTLASISYTDWITSQVSLMGESRQFLIDFLAKRSASYIRIKILQPNIVESIENSLIDDPSKAHYLLSQYLLSTAQYFEPLCASYNSSLSYLKVYGLDKTQNQSNNITFPVEIGNYLMKKIVLHPTSYQACQEVILHYQQNDLYKILESLSSAVANGLKDKTDHDLKELETIMDNAWKDAKNIEGRKETIQDGISVVLGGLGLLASSALGGNPLGLLAGLGFKVADRRLDMKNLSLSDKLAKLASKEYLVNIFNFQKTHKLVN